MSPHVPKILGADVELGNFVAGAHGASDSGREASRLLLSQIPGIAAGSAYATTSRTSYGASWADGPRDAQDWGRRFLPANGGCAYIDLDHLELALPETLSAFDHVAYWRAMLAIARAAAARVNERLPEGTRVHVLANCSDGHGQSYGAHTNVLVTRSAWDAIVRRKPHYLAYLAAFQVSSIVFTGAGKVGAENSRPHVPYQLTQRGDFIETMIGEQTTFHRPIVNARDEPLCADRAAWLRDEPELARLHVIFFDATLCQVATLLRVGTLQIVTALIEAGAVLPSLALDDPLDALQRWGHDPSLSATARLVDGRMTTAVELQQRFLDAARRHAALRGFDGVVPRASEILDLWDDTLVKLRARDFASLSRRIDWVLKRQILERAMAALPGLTWSSPEIAHLDQIYASIDPGEGLFWACEEAGLVDTVVDRDSVQRAMHEPPEDTRAWTRAQILRRAGAGRTVCVDWDRVTLRSTRHARDWGDLQQTVWLPRPFAATKSEHEDLFRPDVPFDAVLDALGSDDREAVAPVRSSWRTS